MDSSNVVDKTVGLSERVRDREREWRDGQRRRESVWIEESGDVNQKAFPSTEGERRDSWIGRKGGG